MFGKLTKKLGFCDHKLKFNFFAFFLENGTKIRKLAKNFYLVFPLLKYDTFDVFTPPRFINGETLE